MERIANSWKVLFLDSEAGQGILSLYGIPAAIIIAVIVIIVVTLCLIIRARKKNQKNKGGK